MYGVSMNFDEHLSVGLKDKIGDIHKNMIEATRLSFLIKRKLNEKLHFFQKH